MSLITILFFILVLIGFTVILVIKNLLYICEPNEVLVFSGQRNKADDDTSYGYRIIKGGRTLKKPLIERIDRLDLTNMVIDLSIQNAYSKGGIPLNVDAVANVKIAGVEPVIHNAIERLLGKTRDEVQSIAQKTLEGNLRGVLATMTPEEINEDKTSFQRNLVVEAEQDLEKLGLVLDTLNIQNIADDRHYLDSIGRKQSAEIEKKARIAEAESKAAAAIKSAQNQRDIALAEIRAESETIKAESERRIIDATTRRDAVIAEQKAEIAALVAKATAELDVQKARIEKIRRQLEADIIEPSKANLQAAISEAIGKAAKIVEEGEATAKALRAVTATWQKAGDNARDIFLLQKMDTLIKQTLASINELNIDQITVLPKGTGQSAPLTSKLLSTSEQLKAALGIDIPEIINSLAGEEGEEE